MSLDSVATCEKHSVDNISSRHVGLQNITSAKTAETGNAISQLLRRASTTNHTRRTLIKGRDRCDNMLSSKNNLISPEEYDKLPASIQRKYFSSEERLKIATQAAADKRQRRPTKKSSEQPTHSLKTPALEKQCKTIRKNDSKKQRRSSLPLAFDIDNSKTWYEPDANNADNQDRPHTSSSHKPTFDLFSWDKSRSTSSSDTSRIPPSPSIASMHSPSPSMAASAHSHESRTSNTRGPSAHSQRHPLPSVILPKSRTPEQERLASRRNFLLHPIPLPPPILAPLPSLPSPETSAYIDRVKQLESIVVHLSSEDRDPTDADTTPTQELESAQMKLKNLPPAWYDEKLDFGFQGDEIRKPSTSTFDSWEHPRTLSPSISDTASSHGPMTPISPAIHALNQAFDKSESQPTLQQIIEQSRDVTNFSHLQQQQIAQGEATYKRQKSAPKHLVDGFYEDQDSNQPYSITIHYDNHDPLALETLPVCDDLTGAHGAFAIHSEHQNSSGFRKVLKVIRGH